MMLVDRQRGRRLLDRFVVPLGMIEVSGQHRSPRDVQRIHLHLTLYLGHRLVESAEGLEIKLPYPQCTSDACDVVSSAD